MTKEIIFSHELISNLFGNYDENIVMIEKAFSVIVRVSPDGITITGEEANIEKAETLIRSLIKLLSDGVAIDKEKVRQSIYLTEDGKTDEIIGLSKDVIAVTAKGRQIKCKTFGQRDYVKAIKNNTLVFGVGPAGTGKTYLAVAMAIMAYKTGRTEKIILSRPVLEAGEKLGFLPGDLQTKVDPYLRPLYDALGDMLGLDGFSRLMDKGVIEVAPLAYMRGRTLSDSFIILDEAQNTTEEQMKMFLTRLGFGSKIVVTGDITQIDLPNGAKSGLIQAIKLLDGIEDIKVVRLCEKDIVRHELVQRIVQAYSKAGGKTVGDK